MRIADLNDKELMQAYYEAIECQDGLLINQCKQEMNDRIKYE